MMNTGGCDCAYDGESSPVRKRRIKSRRVTKNESIRMKSTLVATTFFSIFTLVACSKQTETPVNSVPVPVAPIASISASQIVTVDLSSKLCKVLDDLAPRAPKLGSIGTQVELVLLIAAAFDSNAVALQRVSVEIDAVTTASCPTSRDSLLKVLKMTALHDAVR